MRIAASLLFFSALSLHPSQAEAKAPAAEVQVVLKKSAEDLAEERYSEAVRGLESAADAGLTHPDLSFNRGVAYYHRSKTPSASSRDVGQAAAGFAEAKLLSKNNRSATTALRRIQEAIAARKSQSQTRSESNSLGLAEQFLLLLNPFLLALLSALGSAALICGLLLRRGQKDSSQVTGSVLGLVGGLLLTFGTGLSVLRSSLFDASRVGVVVAETAPLVSEAGDRIKGVQPLRQGTVLYLEESEAGVSKLTSLSSSDHVRTGDIRLLSRPNSHFWSF